jgi:hypothetical protein
VIPSQIRSNYIYVGPEEKKRSNEKRELNNLSESVIIEMKETYDLQEEIQEFYVSELSKVQQ